MQNIKKDISIWNGDIKAATNVREIEKADYDTLHKDYSESVDALGRARDNSKGNVLIHNTVLVYPI